MTAMTIIVAVVVFWALFVLGVLVGISVHREATRRRTHRLDRDRVELELDREDLELDRADLFAGRRLVRVRDLIQP
jgi:hypothetical protein